MKEKEYADEGKYAAPRWLVYPNLSAWTIGWRMGYGEDYRMNEPPRDRNFSKLFPTPRNWLFNPRKSKLKPIPLLGYLWSDCGKPKYSEVGDDAVVVNDFIKMSDEKEFSNDTFHFSSIEHAVLLSKYLSFDKCDKEDDVEKLRELPDLEGEEKENWENFKYTVCLNAAYYKIMQDDELKSWLLSTSDKGLVYESDDEWGGDENLFGFALMELRDEIHRLCDNEDLIDWEYTEYLKNAYPYVRHEMPGAEDRQSPEFRIIESILYGASKYVRDVNLDDKLAGKYEAGQIITEKGFVDASSHIGRMITSHRYLILSGYMADFSKFEQGTDWGLHVANRDSKFKVLDVFTHNGKTQIALLHLPQGFEEVFENHTDIEDEFVEEIREEFINTFDMEVVESLTDEMWLERCSFPLGMNEEGEFF